jgi:DNA-binding NtrC family response regulator
VTNKEIVKKCTPVSIENFKGNGESILVIDDEESQREIAADMLKMLGYKVITVNNGEEAVMFFEKQTVDLIILEMIMKPGIDGLETYQRIIQRHPHQKAVIASGYSETERVKQAQKLGAGMYIRKPYSLENIGTAIRKALKDKS